MLIMIIVTTIDTVMTAMEIILANITVIIKFLLLPLSTLSLSVFQIIPITMAAITIALTSAV